MARFAATGLSAASNLYSTPMAQTVSGAGWSTIATGAWPDKHNVVDHSFAKPNDEYYPDSMSRLEAASPRSSMLVVGTWNPIPDTIFGKATDLRVRGGNDADTTAKAADDLKNGNPDATLVHLDDIDGAGHSAGSSSAAYATAHTTAAPRRSSARPSSSPAARASSPRAARTSRSWTSPPLGGPLTTPACPPAA